MTHRITFYSIRTATAYGGVRVRIMLRVTDLRYRNTGDLFRMIK